MAITAETRTDIIELVVGMFGAAPGASVLSELAEAVDAGLSLKDLSITLGTSAVFKAEYPSFLTNSEFATNYLTNFLGGNPGVVTAANFTLAVDAVVALLNSGKSRGEVVYDVVTAVSAVAETDTNFGPAAALLNNQTEVAEYYSVTSQQSGDTLDALKSVIVNVTGDDATVVTAKETVDGTTNTGTRFSLTTGVDSFTGTTGNDTFVGLIDDNTAAGNTFTAADVIDGGAGTDKLEVIADTSGAGIALPAASIMNIENTFFRNVSGQTLTVDATRMTGEEQIWADRSTAAVVVTNMATGTTLGMKGDGSTTTNNLTATYTSATSANFAVDGDTKGGVVTINGTAMTSLAIASTGGTNTLTSITIPATIAALTIDATTSLDLGTGITNFATAGTGTITVTGASAVDLGSGALPNGVDAIDASGNSGGVTAVLDAETDTDFTGGSGADKVTTGAVLTTLGVVDAGAGTDTLTVADSTHITATVGKQYTNFETLVVADGVTIDLDHVAGITSVFVNDASAAATVVNDLSATQAAALTFTDFNDAATISVKDATTVGTTDTLGITISNGNSTSSETLIGAGTDGADWTIAGVETINLTVVDDFDADAMNSITGMTKLTATGAGDVDIITGALNLGANGVVDFSGITGTVVFNAAALATNAFAFTGGSGVDTVTSSAIGGSIINTGAGNDVITVSDITGGTTATTVNGGAGHDEVTLTVIGNDAQEAVVLKFAAGDSISDSTTTGISNTLTDEIVGMDTATLAAGAGNLVTFDTEVTATAVTAGTTDVVLGTTTVTNAGDFFVNIDAAATVYIYQDTDGDKIIESGEFAIQLTGVTSGIAAAGEFTVSGGNLVFTAA